MKILLIVIFIAALTGAENVRRHRRLVGGKRAEATQFPYQVSLRSESDNTYLCGGSIIHEQFVLTAAHCVYGLHIDYISVVAGPDSNSSLRISYKVDLILIPEDYVNYKNINNIALIKIKNKFNFSTYIQKIELAVPATACSIEYPPVGATMTLIGFGRNYTSGLASGYTRHYTEVTLISMKECVERTSTLINFIFTINHLCTLDEKGPSAGDAGSPLVYDGKQVGIFFGNGKEIGYPDIYVRVTCYVNWIENKIKKYTDINEEYPCKPYVHFV